VINCEFRTGRIHYQYEGEVNVDVLLRGERCSQ